MKKIIIALAVMVATLILGWLIMWLSPNETKTIASDREAGDYFGRSVAIDGDTIVVGAWKDDDLGENSGSAYIYKWNGSIWTETKLIASDGEKGDIFGANVAISGERIVAGASFDDDNGEFSGSVYIYEWVGSAWVETKLIASDGKAEDYFGYGLAISGERIVVGASNYKVDDASGSAYIYDWDGNNWVETKITANDGSAGDFFGDNIATDGDIIVVGAPHDDDNGEDSGSAYIYKWDGSVWIETKILATDGKAHDNFGLNVAVSGEVVVIGAPYDDDCGDYSGVAYIYKWNGSTWVETKLTASDNKEGDRFGSSVAIDGERIIVGAYGCDNKSLLYALIEPVLGVNVASWFGKAREDAGGIYIYKWNGSTWAETKLTASDNKTGDKFGSSVAIDGERIVVGATDEDHSAGAIYIYKPK